MTASGPGGDIQPPKSLADVVATRDSISLGEGRIAATVSTLARGLHALSIVGVVALMVLTLADVVGRGLFGEPVRGTVELTELLVALIVFLALAHTDEMGEHVTVDLIYNVLGDKAQKVVTAISQLLMVSLLLFLAWRMVLQGLHLRNVALTTGVLGLAVWPVLMVGVAGMVAYALVMTGRGIADLRRPLPDRTDRGEGPADPPGDDDTGYQNE